MLARQRRISKTTLARLSKEAGRSFSSPLFTFKVFTQENETAPTAFALIVSSKTEKTAVGRHLMKRRLAVVLADLLVGLKDGYLVLFYLKPGIKTIAFEQLKTIVSGSLAQAKLLK